VEQVTFTGAFICLALAAWSFGTATIGTLVATIRERRNAGVAAAGTMAGGVLYATILGMFAYVINPSSCRLALLPVYGAIALVATWGMLHLRGKPTRASITTEQKQSAPHQDGSSAGKHRIRNSLFGGVLVALFSTILRSGAEHAERIWWIFVPWDAMPARVPYALLMGAGFAALWYFTEGRSKS